MQSKIQLTPVEHELMEILWKLEKGTVRDVMAELPMNRELAYTSVSTILRILQQKKIIKAKKFGKQHVYHPILTREEYTSVSLTKMVKQVFLGNAVNLVNHLVDSNPLSIDEINAIQQLLEHKKKESKNAK